MPIIKEVNYSIFIILYLSIKILLQKSWTICLLLYTSLYFKKQMTYHKYYLSKIILNKLSWFSEMKNSGEKIVPYFFLINGWTYIKTLKVATDVWWEPFSLANIVYNRQLIFIVRKKMSKLFYKKKKETERKPPTTGTFLNVSGLARR